MTSILRRRVGSKPIAMFQLPKLPARCCCCWSLRFPHQALGELVSMKICLNGQRLWVTVLAGCARTLRNVRPKGNDTCRLHGLSTLLTMKCSKISKGWHRIWQNDLLRRSLPGLFWSLFALIWWAGVLVAAGKNHDCLQNLAHKSWREFCYSKL